MFEFKENLLLCCDTFGEPFIPKSKKKYLKYREKVVIVENWKLKSSLIVAAKKREDNCGK